MKIERRQVILGVALIGTLLAVVLVRSPVPEGDVVAPARVATTDQKEVPSAEEGAFGPIHRSEMPKADIDPFRAKSWYVAPAPSEPTAPPLPFFYMGRLEDGGKTTVYLARGEEVFPISVGERFAGSYRLEKIGRGELVIDYLPLSIRQTLPIGMNE